MDDLAAIFKAYDIRGLYPKQINKDVARLVGEAFVAVRQPKTVVVGRDVRDSGEELKKVLVATLLKNGVNVVDIGVITTDQLYFAVGNYGYDAGISVTASHNPSEYSGFKFSMTGGAPISSDELAAMRDRALEGKPSVPREAGKLSSKDISLDYVAHVLSYIDKKAIKPLSLVVNANFGAVGQSVDQLAKVLGLKLERLNWQADGSFPKGPPNPLLPDNRAETVEAIKQAKPDFAVAWDADADRVFFFTGDGEFIPSSFIISLLVKKFLGQHPGIKIVHDVTLCWAVDDAIKAAGGVPVSNRVGHSFIKARMRQEDAPFAAESSGHYYFKDSFYADNGLVPFLLISEIVSKSGKSLAQLVKPLRQKYFMADETNFPASDPAGTIAKLEATLGPEGEVDKTDGVTIETERWRINLRPSNTEPLIRLNAEARSRKALDEIFERVKALIE